jgi:hypothetical protein
MPIRLETDLVLRKADNCNSDMLFLHMRNNDLAMHKEKAEARPDAGLSGD